MALISVEMIINIEFMADMIVADITSLKYLFN